MTMFSNRLREALAEANARDPRITRASLTAHLRTSPGNLSRWLHGNVEPKSAMVLRMAKFLGVDPTWLGLGRSAARAARGKRFPPILNTILPNPKEQEGVVNDEGMHSGEGVLKGIGDRTKQNAHLGAAVTGPHHEHGQRR